MKSFRLSSFLAGLTSAFFAAFFAAAMAIANTNTLASVALFSPQFGPSSNFVWDRNGRYGVFASLAENLVTGQVPSPGRQVFLCDRIAGTVQLVSHPPGILNSGGNGAIGNTVTPQISADGNWVIYSSEATNLVGSQVDGNGDLDVFLWSRANDITTLVSHQTSSATTAGNLFSQAPPGQLSISDDGRFTVFSSSATDLVAGQATNGFEQVYLYDRTSGVIVLVSHAASSLLQSGGERSTYFATPVGRAISGDGRWVVFATLAVNLVSGVIDTNGGFDLYLWDRQATLASSLRLLTRRAGASLTTVNGASGEYSVATDGSAVIFTSNAANVEGITVDINGAADVFRYDRLANVVELVSHAAPSLSVAANGAAFFPSISGDGRKVAFHSRATNHLLFQNDVNGERDVFLWQVGTAIQLMSHVPGNLNETGNGASIEPWIAENGAGVAFHSMASDLVAGDGNGVDDVFFRLRGGAPVLPILVSHVPSGSASSNGKSTPTSVALAGALVAFDSEATDLVPSSFNSPVNVFFHGSVVMADTFESGDLTAWSLVVP